MTHDSKQDDRPVTLINIFEVAPQQVDAFIDRWRERATLMRSKPGFVDSRLHRALESGTRFQLVNVAHWESAEAMQVATQDAEFQERIGAAVADKRTVISAHPALYRVAVDLRRP